MWLWIWKWKLWIYGGLYSRVPTVAFRVDSTTNKQTRNTRSPGKDSKMGSWIIRINPVSLTPHWAIKFLSFALMGLFVASRFCRPVSYTHQQIFFFVALLFSSGPGSSRCRSLTITLRHTTLGSTPLDETLARRRDLKLRRQNSHKKQTSMPPVGFKPTSPSRELPQTSDLDRAAAGIGMPTRKFWKYKTEFKIPGECVMS
jgi:hypothetical protein